ncbi:MAG: helix-turn-helix domain-containing protein, partial [Tannerellaceae bacterium]|nr:helix-turn-helix domain-containing protein [Tannerellaceae bacterium]
QIPINSEIISLPGQTEEEAYEGEIRLLYQLIEQQSALDKALLLLYLDQVRYHDIASILGISESNVATKINRLKKKIKKYVEHIKKQPYEYGRSTNHLATI